MKSLLKLLLLLGLLVNAAHADETMSGPLKVYWDCSFSVEPTDLPADKYVSCENLVARFIDLDKGHVIQVSKVKNADLWIQLGNSFKTKTEISFKIKILPSTRFKSGSLELPLINFSTSQEANVSIGSLVAYLVAGVSTFEDLRDASIDNSGNLVLHTIDTPSAPTDDTGLEESPWYFAGAGSGGGSTQGKVVSKNVSSSVAANYRTQKFRIELDANGNYSAISQPTETGVQKGNLFAPTVQFTGAVSTSKHWSFAILGETGDAKGANLRDYYQANSGVEYVAIPYRMNERNQLVIRLVPGFVRMDLMSENDRGRLQEKLFYAYTQIAYINTIASAIHFTVGAKTTHYFGAPGYEEYSVKAKADFDVGKKLTLQTKVSYKYSKDSFIYPKNPDYSNAAQEAFVEGVAPGVNSSYSFGVFFHLGNQKRLFDERWSTAY